MTASRLSLLSCHDQELWHVHGHPKRGVCTVVRHVCFAFAPFSNVLCPSRTWATCFDISVFQSRCSVFVHGRRRDNLHQRRKEKDEYTSYVIGVDDGFDRDGTEALRVMSDMDISFDKSCAVMMIRRWFSFCTSLHHMKRLCFFLTAYAQWCKRMINTSYASWWSFVYKQLTIHEIHSYSRASDDATEFFLQQIRDWNRISTAGRIALSSICFRWVNSADLFDSRQRFVSDTTSSLIRTPRSTWTIRFFQCYIFSVRELDDYFWTRYSDIGTDNLVKRCPSGGRSDCEVKRNQCICARTENLSHLELRDESRKNRSGEDWREYRVHHILKTRTKFEIRYAVRSGVSAIIITSSIRRRKDTEASD